MLSRRFLAMAVAAGMMGLGACEGAGEHNVPDEDGAELPATATLQDSAAVGEAVVNQAPVDPGEIKMPPPALPPGTGNTPVSMDTIGGSAPAGGPTTQPTLTPGGAPVNPTPAPTPR